MRRWNLSLCIALSLALLSCDRLGYETTQDGILVSLPQKRSADARKVRLQVMNEKIIRVSATPERRFPQEQSLIIVPRERKRVAFTVEETERQLTLRTSAVQVQVDRNTGAVVFADKDGNVLLRESAGGGKRFTPIQVEETKGFTVRQVFESPQDEAFYGLGQHQSDEFNYKGKNEVLLQYNTKVSVPFVLSNKHYGILWDNYSLSRFGDSREYAQLSDNFKLYDAHGNEGGLTAVYTPASKEAAPVERIENRICYEDLRTVQDFPKGFPLLGSRVTYSGSLAAKEEGTYRFHLYYAGYVKVYVDNQLVVSERWRTAWNPNSYKFALPLKAGKRVPLRVEWVPDGGTSYLGLRALSPVETLEQGRLALESEMGTMLDYYFVYGEDMDSIISGYRTLTGKAPIMPKWSMGFWQSRERYKTQNEICGALREFRRRHIPLDNIVLDWSYWPEEAWGSHEFDQSRFPNPKAMLDTIHALHAQMMISVWPKFYASTEHFKEFDAKGWMYKQAVKDSIRDWIGPGYIGSFYDAYAKGARKLFWQQMKEHLYPLGIDAWWMDASEPNVRDCTDLPYRKALCGPTALGPSTQYFNAYALMNAKAIYEGLMETDPNHRVFQLTRSGFAGLQRYATATWSGDIATRWEDMKAQISAGLNYSMSGIPYWTMDIGGFCVENRYVSAQRVWNDTGVENEDLKEWRELNARWYQFGAFTPLFRAHGQYPYREVYNLAPESHPAYKSIVAYDRLRYRMLPYIYSLAGKAYWDDYTIMRALVMDFGRDKQTEDIGDQFLLGPWLMVCPVYVYGARSREVYFPATTGWYDFYTGKHIPGGQRLTVDAPYERIPLYLREGTIMPYGPAIEYVDQQLPADITLYVYTGQDGAFTLYEDEGVNYNYEKGKYSLIPMHYDEATRTLVIGDRQGEYDGMLRERVFRVVFVSKDAPKASCGDAKGIKVEYKGKRVRVSA